ncbi:hypothetical protein Gogos_009022, partial [Gossypium gossypioides]|nr:hypothetical protein [Gossypium gossypioides]
QHLVTAVTEEKGTTCWGCGLGLLLPTLGPAFKCGWCGAITNHNLNKTQNQCFLWRRLRDRCFVSFLFSFMLFVICKLLHISILHPHYYINGIVHSVITTILALTTISTFDRELCRRSESSALHSFSNFSYIQHNLRNSDVCIYEFPYMAAIEVQTARTLDHFQHGSGDVGKQGRSCGIVKLSNGTAGKRVGFNLSFHCQHIGGDKFKRTAMAATVLHIRRANIPQPFEFTGRGSCERKRLPESIALLRVSVFDVEILAHSAEFAKETQDVNIFVVS